MGSDAFVIGVDFGTDSVRSVIVDGKNGQEIISDIFYYPRWKDGLYCDSSINQFRQHPLDYLEGLEQTIKNCLTKAGPGIRTGIKAVSIDTTGSTPIAVDEKGIPLSLLAGFEENPNAMFVLWKDHCAVKEAAEINAHAARFDTNYLQFAGGIYSSEWFWAKLLYILRIDDKVRKACYSWVEHCDWIPFVLTGGDRVSQMKRSVCAAGHKALWSETFGGLPPNKFFTSLDPLLEGFTGRLFKETFTSAQPAGCLSAAWKDRLGLSGSVIVGIGAFDAHMGAVGGQIEPYHLSKVMGTSTCDMLVAPMEEVKDIQVNGICGQVPGSIIPGMMGMEAGQSAFGDSYAWFSELLCWPLRHILTHSALVDQLTLKCIVDETSGKIIAQLSKQAEALPLDENDTLAVDWLNGRRTPDASQLLKAAVTGLDLGTDAPGLFRAIVESTCFGAKAIVDRFYREGIAIKGLIGLGGVARKSPFIMQMMSDIIDMPIRIHGSEQTCALGASMFAATAAGLYEKVEDAMNSMGQGFNAEYFPDSKRRSIYAKRYEQYKNLGSFIELQTTI